MTTYTITAQDIRDAAHDVRELARLVAQAWDERNRDGAGYEPGRLRGRHWHANDVDVYRTRRGFVLVADGHGPWAVRVD